MICNSTLLLAADTIIGRPMMIFGNYVSRRRLWQTGVVAGIEKGTSFGYPV
jgi:hypothetical protein